MSAVDFRLYLITDGAGESMNSRVERALAGVPRGSVAVQLRAKHLQGRSLLDAARALRLITRQSGALLFINDRVDVALAARADGVHLPSRGLPTPAVHRLAPQLLVGVSTHSLVEALAARDGGAHFVTFGPVWETPSKANLGIPVGPDALARVTAALSIPVFALGGVDLSHAGECASRGARLACIRAVLDAADPALAAAHLVAVAAASR